MLDGIFQKFNKRAEEIGVWLVNEYGNIRTGRASPAVLDNVHVESYGQRQPLKHVSSISIDDPKSLKVVPWDKSQIPSIESAIKAANLGVSVSSDSSGVRVSFPALTTESRQTMIKLTKEKLEEARVSIKKEREVLWSTVQSMEKDSKITEDEKFKAKDDLQKRVDEINKSLDEAFTKKEKELSEV